MPTLKHGATTPKSGVIGSHAGDPQHRQPSYPFSTRHPKGERGQIEVDDAP
jgi:hypothetical protein